MCLKCITRTVQYIPQKRTLLKWLIGDIFLVMWHSDITFYYLHRSKQDINNKKFTLISSFLAKYACMSKEPMLYWGTTTTKQHGLVDKTSMIYKLKTV